ncbi:MAG: diaminopimelate epimerase [Bacteroidales bacterium]|nr:diaminopimelate epimerase [Bacteroidales bacterium]
MAKEEVLEFTKMHGIGNDYIYLDCRACFPENLPELSYRLSDRHRSIGGDGIITVSNSDVADLRMRIFNADGSEARMCGNGARCVGKLAYDHGMISKTRFTLETLGGIKTLDLHLGTDGKVESVTVDMGEPSLVPAEIPVITDGDRVVDQPVRVGDTEVRLTAVSMGNPHAVVFVDDLSTVDVHGLGRKLEWHRLFPERANIEFAQVLAPGKIRMRVWERGSGETQACGTGACAVAVAAAITGRSPRKSLIHLLGGDLQIDWSSDDNHVYMTGPAEETFTGTVRV